MVSSIVLTNDENKPRFAKRAAIYIRVSEEKQQEEGYSLESQERRCREYCSKQGYVLNEEHIYQDVKTGILYRERPGLSALRSAARRHEFDILVIYDLDRFSRDPVHQAIVIEDLEYYNVKVECVLRKLDDSPEGKLVQYILGFSAKLEHERICERTQRGRISRALSGKMLGQGQPLYGYTWNEDRTAYLIEPNEAEVVRFAFESVAQGKSIRSVAKSLEQQGILTRQGKKFWRPSTLGQMLSNRFYIGEAVLFRYRRVSGDKRETVQVKDQVKLPEGTVPAIIDTATFEKVQQQLQINKQSAARNNKNPQDALLRCGLVICGHCNHSMGVKRNRSWNFVSYLCGNYVCCRQAAPKYTVIPAASLDKAVWQRAIEIIRNPSLVEEAINAQMPKDEHQEDMKVIKGKLADIERRRKQLTAALEDDIDEDTYKDIKARLKLLAEEKQAWEKELKRYQNEQALLEEERAALEDFKRWCTEEREKLDDPNYETTYENRRRACIRLGIKAVVWRPEHKPRFKIIVSPPEIVSRNSL